MDLYSSSPVALSHVRPHGRVPRLLYDIRAAGLTATETKAVSLNDEPRFPCYLVLPDVDAWAGRDVSDIAGCGIHAWNDNLACLVAHAECLERLCGEILPPHRGERGTWSENPKRIDPASFWYKSPARAADPDGVCDELRQQTRLWWPVSDALTGEWYQIPAQLIFTGPSFEGEIPIRPERLSTGSAFGQQGSKRAIAMGLFENIERDAMIGAWLRQRPLRRIVGLPPALRTLQERLQRYYLEPLVLELPTDFRLPTVLVLLLDRTGVGPAVTYGAATRTTYAAAIEKSLLEACQSRAPRRLWVLANKPPTPTSPAEIVSDLDRVLWWYPVARLDDLSLWTETDHLVLYDDLERGNFTLESAIQELARLGFQVLVADIALPELARHGWEVLKLVVPGLHPLYVNENAKSLSSSHFGDLPEHPGLPPHPFI